MPPGRQSRAAAGAPGGARLTPVGKWATLATRQEISGARGVFMGVGEKRLDVCLGDFAVSIQGYDEPVAVLEQVLDLARQTLDARPDIANSEVHFTESMISDLIERVAARHGMDPDNLAAAPGLLLVHRMAPTDEFEAADGGDGDRQLRLRPAEVAREAEPDTAETRQRERELNDEHFAAIARRLSERGEEPPEPADSEPGETAGEDADVLELGEAIRAEPSSAGTGEAGEVINIFAPDGDEEGEGGLINIFGEPGNETPDGPAPAERKHRRRPLFGAKAPAPAPSPPPAPEEPAAGGGRFGAHFESLLARVHGKQNPNEAASRPKEVSAPAPRPDTGGMSADEIARAVGAETAAEHLLSAAAHVALVRNKPRFTRREVLDIFESMTGDFPRTLEAKIKGMGKLVRQSDLLRLDDEHFSLSGPMKEQFRKVIRR